MCAAVRARGWIDSGISSVVMTASLISDKSTKSHKYQRIARSDTPQPPPRLAAQRTASFGGICAFERISCPDYVFYVHSAPQTACICCHGGISVAGDRAILSSCARRGSRRSPHTPSHTHHKSTCSAHAPALPLYPGNAHFRAGPHTQELAMLRSWPLPSRNILQRVQTICRSPSSSYE